MNPRLVPLLVALPLAGLLAGCELFGESAEKLAAQREAEGKAIGGGCRHAGRAIEDCFVMNKRADKAALFAGWREMNDYMRENKIEPITPTLTAQQSVRGEAAAEPAKPAAADAPKPAAAEADARPKAPKKRES